MRVFFVHLAAFYPGVGESFKPGLGHHAGLPRGHTAKQLKQRPLRETIRFNFIFQYQRANLGKKVEMSANNAFQETFMR